MDIRRYEIQVKGISPLLMHWDNIEWADHMAEWRKDPQNKKNSKAGDDRTPAWQWLGCLYNDGEHIVIPQEPLLKSFMKGGAAIGTGHGKLTFKGYTQSGIIPEEPFFKLMIKGHVVRLADVWKLSEEPSFAKHVQEVQKFGFTLFTRRAAIGQAKHIRVRPRFDDWGFTATVSVIEDKITTEVLQQIATTSGQYAGIGDWRPGCKTPGPWGRYSAKVVEL